ncbi:hypothetical protein HGM15179_010455 [Zosterops borbonicus]|uniref:Uncharacterized protein n=1 Tax=Zosterops borbonicus TaxID=364589 RepID=A0A8K1LK09_9PASS|nr:hypothetical protein HGM15179_010455 [Zosterops borbonicus]
MRTHLEFCIYLWGLQHKKHMDLLQEVQRRGTKMMRGLGHLCYGDRLGELGFFQLGEEMALGKPHCAIQRLKGAYKKEGEMPFTQANCKAHLHWTKDSNDTRVGLYYSSWPLQSSPEELRSQKLMEGDVQGGRALHAMGEGCGKTKSFAVPACMGYQVTGIQQEGGIVALVCQLWTDQVVNVLQAVVSQSHLFDHTQNMHVATNHPTFTFLRQEPNSNWPDFILYDLENFALISTRAEMIPSPGFQLILGISG